MLRGLLGSLLKRNKQIILSFFSATWNVDAMPGASAAILTYTVTLGREFHTQMVEQIKQPQSLPPWSCYISPALFVSILPSHEKETFCLSPHYFGSSLSYRSTNPNTQILKIKCYGSKGKEECIIILLSIKAVRGCVKGMKSSPVGWAGIKKEESFRQTMQGAWAPGWKWAMERAGDGYIWIGINQPGLKSVTIFSKSPHCSMPQFPHL